ncbi:ABC transporter permease [Mycoplasmopsis primatum]|uniref:ABC transporter permease n=1 Tax=Mycoplasmopsis primatum TaxID=55604 RepID=UPI000497A87F|nr:ABC transporter permease [Mycoplasmopsis primatum]
MWRLFKEVFKSLAKNKVMVIGLSILIFLTSMIFTLLSTLRTSIVSGFNNYKNVSKKHDISVDLNLPSQGTSYNQGYFVNGEVLDANSRSYKPIEYYIKNATGEYSDINENILYLQNDKYINLSNLTDKDTGNEIIANSKDYFIKREDLETLYTIYNTDKRNANVEFNLGNNESDANNAFFTIKNKPTFFKIYKKDNDAIKELTKKVSLDANSMLSFEKPLKISDLMLVKKGLDEKEPESIYALQAVPLFINVIEKKITNNYELGMSWVNNNVGISISPSEWLKAFGFEKVPNNDFVFKQKNKSIDLSQFIDYPNGSFEIINDFLTLKAAWKLGDFYSQPVEVFPSITIEFKTNQKIAIDKNLLANKRQQIVFERWNYHSTFVGQYKSLWTGAFHTFMSQLEDDAKQLNSSAYKKWKELLEFSNWEKSTRTRIKPFDLVKYKEKSTKFNTPIDINDLDQFIYTSDKENRTNIPNGKEYKINKDNWLRIVDIEHFLDSSLTKDEKINILNDREIKNKMFNFIKQEAYEVTKNLIISKVKNIVNGEQNLGLRKTITVDGINSETGKQNIFHFINIGDQNNTVDGVKLNVGKLYNEKFKPSAIVPTAQNDQSIYKQNQIPPYIASLLIQSIGRNLFPNPNYIQPIYEFSKVMDFNPKTKDIKYEDSKIILLNKYLITNDNKYIDNEKLKNSYKTLNLGITFRGNNFKLVSLVNENGKLIWKTVYADGMDFAGFDKGLLTSWLIKNNLTIATQFIKTNNIGWVKNDPSLANIYYIPLQYLSPKAGLLNNILVSGKVDYLADAIENQLLNSNLVKDKFISLESVFQISKALKKVLNDNNFVNVFTSGKINNEILPKIGFDLVYELSNNQENDGLKSILISIFERIKAKIGEYSADLNEQKKYLANEVQNIYEFLKQFINVDLNKYFSADDLVNLSYDPKKVILAIQNIVTSIDLNKFSSLSHDWYKNQWKKVIEKDGEKYTTKLSSGLIINWLFKSIDQKMLKKGLEILINNLDMSKTLDLDNNQSVLSKLLIKTLPFLRDSLKPILKKINSDGNYQEFKSGLISIINNIDFKVLSQYIENHMKVEYLEYKKSFYDYESNSEKVLKEKVMLKTISPKDGMMALIHGLFYNLGTSREFKNNLVKMFNLSDKTVEKEIEINGIKRKIILPDKDDDKLSFYDFLSLFTSGLESSEWTEFFNYKIEQEVSHALANIQELMNKNNSSTIEILKLNSSTQKTLIKFNLVKGKTQIGQLEIQKLLDIQKFIYQTTGGTSRLLESKNKTGADLISDLYHDNNGDATWLAIKKLLTSFMTLNIKNKYSLGAQAFDLYLPWINILSYNKDVTQNEANKFLNDLLKVSIDDEILEKINVLATDENLPLYEKTGFGISKALHHYELIDIFDYDGSKFINKEIEKVANDNPKFKKYLIDQKAQLIELFGLIGASAKYSKSDKYPHGIYHFIISKFFSDYLSTKDFWNIKEAAQWITYKMQVNFPVELFGLSRVLINPVLRAVFPQVTMSFISVEKTKLSRYNGNLAYIVMEKIGNIEEIIRQRGSDLEKYFEILWRDIDTSSVPIDFNEENVLVLDGAKNNKIFAPNKKASIFGLNLFSFINNIMDAIVEPKEMKDIVFNDINSYFVKVNYAYLAKNNKAIYNGKIPQNSIEMEAMLNTIESKYVLDVNGIKFLIIGEDTTIDYIYPVIDENNLQVNTENQALVYVNNYGFSRIAAAYQGNVIKKNLLVANGSNLSNKELKEAISNIVSSSISDANKLQRVFLYNEIDPINPERALRLSTIEGMIQAISSATIILMTVFIVMVAIAIIFVIRRYIANKAKVFGILLAQGYRPIEVALSLIVFAIVTSLIGGILGYAVGFRSQLLLQNVFSAYWTLPKTSVSFDFFALFFTVFIPFIGMSLLIIVVALISLRKKPNELITGVNEAPKGKWFNILKRKFINKKNIKKRFSFTLAYNGFWKLTSFGASVLLTSVATMFGLASHNTFNNTIDKTYENRNYKFKVDLVSPTEEGGYYSTYSLNDLKNLIYTPIGNLAEGNREVGDYFKPGKSSIINPDNRVNGAPNVNDSHVLSQFGVNVSVAAGVAADPWLVAYNGMPDSQKAKIDKLRDLVGYQLEWSQSLDDNGEFITDANKPILEVDNKGFMWYKDSHGKKYDFFKYYKSPHDKQGSFKIAKWDEANNEYVMQNIKTGENGGRDKYRDFIVRAYKKINIIAQRHERAILNKQKIINPIKRWKKTESSSNYWIIDKSDLDRQWVNDYFISFGGVLLDKAYDETYTYLDTTYNNSSFKIYGYKKPKNNDDAMVKLKGKDQENLYDLLYSFKVKDNIYPLVVNEVFSKRYKLYKGDIVEFKVNNRMDRYKVKLLTEIYSNNPIKQKEIVEKFNNNSRAIFKIVGYNPTYINNELITTYDAANKLVGFADKNAFNGVMTKRNRPIQVTDSTSLYSMSGYWSGLDGFDISSFDSGTIKRMFDQIFDIKNGVLSKQHKLSAIEIAKFLDPKAESYSASLYNNAKLSAKDHIERFSKIYQNKLYVALSLSIDSKDIEVGFTQQISSTIENISIFIITISFIISLVILIIMASIMVSENERNIAIWSILGYSQKEKLKMFFGAFLPFLFGALLFAIPIVFLMIYTFNTFLLSSASIALILTLKWWHVILTFFLLFGIFIITSLSVWVSINKMKPVDLLKGK